MPTTPRQTATLALATFALLFAGGCSQHKSTETFYLVANNLKLPYWQTLGNGFNKAATEYGVKVQIVGPDTYDSQAELTEFHNAVAKNPAGILVSVADASLFRSEINDAITAGVPVITVDSDAPTSQRLFFIGTDNLAAGHLGGQRLVEKLGGKGNVIFFSITGQPNLQERLQGYKDIFADHPGMKIIDVLDVKGDANLAFDQARKYVDKTGPDKINAFVALESAGAPAIEDVVSRSADKSRTVIGMDVSPDTLKLIKAGTLDSTISQKPWTMGYVGLKALDEIHHHKPQTFQTNYQVDSFSRYPTFIDTGTTLVTSDNVDIFLESEKKANQ